MRLLIIDDSAQKTGRISTLAKKANPKALVKNVECVADAMRELQSSDFDLVVIDLMLPLTPSGKATEEGGVELLKVINASRNKRCHVLALTEYPELAEKFKEQFAARGIVLVKYDPIQDDWKFTLDSFFQRSRNHSRKDFVVVLALDIERLGFQSTAAKVGKSHIDNRLNVQDIEFNNLHGSLVLLPRAGLSNASAVTAIAVERFQPKVVCMSGICAGVEGQVNLGQVVVAHPCWEYQVGKYKQAAFESEPYQREMTDPVRKEVEIAAADDEFVFTELYAGIADTRLQRYKPLIRPFASGSAVVADLERLETISLQHRKAAALDMEAFGVYNAVHLSDTNCSCFVAKSVVDFADNSKSDAVHDVAAVISARFTLRILSQLLS